MKKECIFKSIIRIKNGFNDKEQKFNIENPKYCDIKCNILIEMDNIIIIMETQFILSCLLKSKKYSHKLYNITRIKDIVDYTYSFIEYQPPLESILLNCVKKSYYFMICNFFYYLFLINKKYKV